MPGLRSICPPSFCLALVVLAAGCQPEGPSLGNVSGVVTLDGTPVAAAMVSFALRARDDVRPAMALTGPDGRYEILYSTSQSGAPVGVNDVLVIADDNTTPGIPGRYAVPGELEYDVQPGPNTVDLVLTSKK